MTRTACLAAIRALPHMAARSTDGEFRITYRGLSADRAEAVACYTDCPDDALGTARHMSAHAIAHGAA